MHWNTTQAFQAVFIRKNPALQENTPSGTEHHPDNQPPTSTLPNPSLILALDLIYILTELIY